MTHIRLEYLSLTNYRNYPSLVLDFPKKLNVITGLNGAGKTTILDAIYLSCNGKSYFTHLDRFIYKTGEEFFRVEARISDSEHQHNCKIISQIGKKKTLELDGKKLKTLADLVGRFPAFMIAPRDILILMDSSVERRKVMDRTISHSDRQYLTHLLKYNKLLKQRNALLKQAQKKGMSNNLLMESIDEGMLEPAEYIHHKRVEYLKSIEPLMTSYYQVLSDGSETISLSYKSQLNDNKLEALLRSSLRKDILLAKTSCGVHKDDLVISIDGKPIKKYASQGQLKSAIIALKISHMDWIMRITGKRPILLLDDIFDKLDAMRVEKVLEISSRDLTSQIFITDTDKDRVGKNLQKMELDYQEFVIKDGKHE